MKKLLVLFAAMAAASAMPVNAAVINLFEWGINIDGSTACSIGTPCDSNVLPVTVDDSGFDFVTGLGTISYTITGDGAHYTSLYVDHEIDNTDGTGFFNEFGNSGGTMVTGQSWEIDDPFFGDIFDNFSAGNLDGSNGVPADNVNDVAMALAWDFILGADETATVDYTVSLIAPTDGFFLLSLTDPDTIPQETIYFSSALNIGFNPVPVPAAWLLFGSGLVGLMGTCYRRKSQKA